MNGGAPLHHVPLLVLGADIDGLAAALALAHQGFPVHVLDRGPHPRLAAESDPTVVPLPPAATRELAVLGLLDAVAARASEPPRLVHGDARTGATLRVAELGPAVRARFGHPYLMVRRATLRTILAEACDADEMISVEFARRAGRLSDVGEATVVECDDGVAYRAEALIGADGPGSHVRAAMGGGHAVSAPYALHHVPASVDARDDDIHLWSSPTIHVTQVPAPGGGADVSVVVRIDPEEPEHGLLGRLLDHQHQDVRAVARGAAGTAPTRVLRHHEPLAHWRLNRMTVLGTAAHPMLPHTAQGPAQALTDAGALGVAFDHADGRIVPALDAYERLRARPAAAAAAGAADFADLCHAVGLTRRLRDRLWSGHAPDAVADVVGPFTAER